MRSLYRSVAKVLRLQATITNGIAGTTWAQISDMVDPFYGRAGHLQCRLDLQFTRPGKDIQMPLVAGRAPDRVGVLFFDCAAGPSGALLVRAGDRLEMTAGPHQGTFEIRVIPEVAQDFTGAHHVEIQVIEVSQAMTPGSVTPFPGSAP
jgi:hypothetical protein